MSSRSARRRQRKAKQNGKKSAELNTNNAIDHELKQSYQNYGDRFRIIEQPQAIRQLLLHGYIRQNTKKLKHINTYPLDIIKLCINYSGDYELKGIDQILSTIIDVKFEQKPGYEYWMTNDHRFQDRVNKHKEYMEKAKNTPYKLVEYCTFNLNSIFNDLTSFQKRSICKRLIRHKKYPVHELRAWPIEQNENYNTKKNKSKHGNLVFAQFYFIEYILYKRYHTILSLDLSEMNYNDTHILYLCNSIENIIGLITQKKRKKVEDDQKLQEQKSNDEGIKTSAQRPQKENKKRGNNQKNKTTQTNNAKPRYSRNRNAQREIERQLQNMKNLRKQKQLKIDVKMKLNTLNLSGNNGITDKHIPLLLRTIKRYMPDLKSLELSSTKITNKSLPVIMKYNIKTLKIDLSNCKGVTLKGLKKYQRGDYEDETPTLYCYCENMVYFVNEKEEKELDNNKPKGGKYVRGKGKKFKANRKRTLYTGADGVDTGYLSMEDWWAYA